MILLNFNMFVPLCGFWTLRNRDILSDDKDPHHHHNDDNDNGVDNHKKDDKEKDNHNSIKSIKWERGTLIFFNILPSSICWGVSVLF